MLQKILTPLLLFLVLCITSLAQQPVKMHEGVKIGGIKQWIGATSKDDSKPILLFLHGGPGFSSRAYSKKFIKHLKEEFIVVQWDQRGTGITKAWNPESDTVSIALMHNDTKEVVQYLLKKFNKEKLYLVGFSWGGFLGHHFASEHPELLHAYISVSSMIHQKEADRLTLNLLKEKASESDNKEATEALAEVNVPINSWQDLYILRKWTAHFSSEEKPKRTYPEKLFEQWSEKWMDIYSNASAINQIELAPTVSCPIYFFVSEKDLVANYTLTKKYYDLVEAPGKQFVWFNESTHEIPNEETRKFSEEILKVKEIIGI